MRVGDEEVAFAGPGQRDHSWGARDWFAVDWMWSALHLDDGTHTHAVGVPQMPGYGVGYVQRGGELGEIESVTRPRRSPPTASSRARDRLRPRRARDRRRARRLRRDPARGARRARLALPARDVPRAHGDGRTGTGWVEWNRNQHGADGKAANPS